MQISTHRAALPAVLRAPRLTMYSNPKETLSKALRLISSTCAANFGERRARSLG